MRRLKILFYWLFRARHNVSFTELIQFLLKPTVPRLALHYIKSIEESDQKFSKIYFRGIEFPLYWPKQFPIAGVYQVCTETFDPADWHYYQKKHTEVLAEEYILDIGTAEGLMPLSIASKAAKLILIEPNRHFQEALTYTFAPFKEKVRIIHSAVGKEQGVVFFQDASLSSVVSQENEQTYQVPINTIDSLVAEESRITYLKADIEGFEYEMLLGAEATIRKHKPKIAITSYHNENKHEEIIALIKSYVPEYKYYVKGIFHEAPRPVMIHFYL